MTAPALRPLSTGEILDVAFGVYRRHFVPLVSVTALMTSIPLLIGVYIESAGGVVANISLWLMSLVLSIVLGSVATAASVFIISESYLGRTLSAADALHHAVPFIWRIVALSVLTSFVIGLGLLLLLVPGIILLCGLVISTPALVVENLPHATDAMGRAWGLTRGYRLRMLGLLVVVAVVIYVPIAAIGAVGGVLAAMGGASLQGEGSAAFVVGLAAFSGLMQILITPLLYATLTIAYYDLRVRKEGFDLEILAQGLSAA